jgi:hypothetical protein
MKSLCGRAGHRRGKREMPLPTRGKELSASDRARLKELRRSLAAAIDFQNAVIELFTASCTAYRERTGKELDIADPAAHLTEKDKLRALEIFEASRRQAGNL